MIAHLLTLWRKELRQQRWALLAVASLYAVLGFGTWVAGQKDGASTSQLSGLSTVLRLFVPLLALTQAQVAVVREYRLKTQLFLEALPLRRWEVPLAKLCWGLLTQSVLAVGLWVGAALASGETSERFLLITGTRLFSSVLVCWSVAFGLATLGRLRWVVYVTLVIGCFLLDQRGVELRRFGPFALLDPLSFPYERASFPVRALLESAGLTAGGLLLGLGLPLFHEGSMAEVLARRASTGEKAGFWIMIAAQLLLTEALDREQRREVFVFTDSRVVASERQNVQIMYGHPDIEARARSLLDVLERVAEGFATELGVANPPPLRVAHNASLEGPSPRIASAEVGAGVLLEANLGAEGFDLAGLSFLAAHETFHRLSEGRALFEPNHWFADGFASYWAPPRDPQASDGRWLDALVARRTLPLDERQLAEWEQLSERVGDDAAVSICFTLVEVLDQRHGRERLLELARAVLARPTVKNGFDWLFAERADLPASLQQLTGESWPELVAAYHAQLDAAALRLAAPLAAIPALRASLAVERTDVGNDIVYQLSGPAPTTTLDCELRHLRLLPYDLVVGNGLLKQPIPWPAGAPSVEGRLRGRYASGQRAFASVDCQVPGLRRKVRLEVRRLEVP
ncbi:MAG: hypothetical protein RL685_6169 [Pseudomonadota bacterium]